MRNRRRAETPNATVEQSMPKGRGVDVAGLVHRDIESRIGVGRGKYGERLTTHNGRDALVDAYQESLDLVVYLRQAIYERDNPDVPGDIATIAHTLRRRT
jgi:hypothetical protein